MSETWRCPECGHTYDSPVSLNSVWHKCKNRKVVFYVKEKKPEEKADDERTREKARTA